MHLPASPNRLRHACGLAALVAACALSPSALATGFSFDILYSGNGTATLLGGSDEPNGTVLQDGDSFRWSIFAAGDSFWDVLESKSYFPLMAFATNEPGVRIGDLRLRLSFRGQQVFEVEEFDVLNSEVHVGTNGVSLSAGLRFDEMVLDYDLTSATDVSDDTLAIDTTLSGRLPIFGTPEANAFATGIVLSAVPEPMSWAMLLAGLGLIGGRARKTLGR